MQILVGGGLERPSAGGDGGDLFSDEALAEVGGAGYLARLASSAATIINAAEYGPFGLLVAAPWREGWHNPAASAAFRSALATSPRKFP